jgi:putative alpha-1,2-mannosidase
VTNAYESVDPFLGNWETDMPHPRGGLADRWLLPKALTGNTHPGAALPLGMVTALPYSGGYVTGYGPYEVSCSGLPRLRPQGHIARGVTHFHHSGTGTVGHYYNYARVSLTRADLAEIERPILDESARPGFYAARFDKAGPAVELTVTRRAALHRYTLAGDDPRTLLVNLASAGLDVEQEAMQQHPTAATIRLVSPTRAEGELDVDDIHLYVVAELRETSESACLFQGQDRSNEQTLDVDRITDRTPLGAAFTLPTNATQCEIRLGFSYRSIDRAREALAEIDAASFDEIATRAAEQWREHLEAFDIEADSPEAATVFYSAVYHSLIKPVSTRDESPLWPDEGPCLLDLCTLWDQYKTLYPMLFTVYPQVGRDLVATLLTAAKRFGTLWRAYLTCPQPDICSKQASGLGHITLADAFFRLPDAADWSAELELICESLLADEKTRTFVDEGIVHPISHTLDLCEACFGLAKIARAVGDDARGEQMETLAAQWPVAYDEQTGLVVDSTFYEGSRWTYSFRPMHDMAGRIARAGGVERFVELLDDYFGFDATPVTQPGRGQGLTEAQWAEQRFEGLNNETDMETPYTYIYAGRHDRACDVLAAARGQFRTGRNGLPGNDDSGGLSSWYVWAAMGIFPVAGQPLWLIGSPAFRRASMAVAGGRFEIVATGHSPEAIYVTGATLNGQTLDRAWLRPEEVSAGGTLELHMSATPGSWPGQLPA